MAIKRTVVLQGVPTVNEEGACAAEVRPGYLVKGSGGGTIAHQTGTGWVPKAVALERSELGAGIDNTYQQTGTQSAYYASGEVVKVGVFKSGDRAIGYVASGQNIAADDYLQSAGDGTYAEGTTNPIARSLDSPGAVTTLTAIRVEFL